MSRTPSPALSFYLKHAADCDSLWLEEEAPKGVSSEDWEKFVDVRTRASEQAADFLIACREEAIKSFSVRFNVMSRKSLKKARETWDAWVEVNSKAAKSRKRFLFGCALAVGQSGTPALYSYVYPLRASELLDLVGWLKDAGFSAELPDPQGDDWGGVTLSSFPLQPQSDLDEAKTACLKPFVELANAL